MGGRQDSGHSLARTDVNVTQPAVTSSDFYSNSMAPPTSLAPTDFFPGVIDTSPWGQKVCEELESFPSLDPDVTDFSNGIMGHDENTPIIDLRQYNGMPQQEHDSMANLNPHTTRRLSESSFSMSSTGGVLPEPVAYEDLGTSEPVSYPSEYDTWSRPEPSQSHLLSRLRHRVVLSMTAWLEAGVAPAPRQHRTITYGLRHTHSTVAVSKDGLPDMRQRQPPPMPEQYPKYRTTLRHTAQG